MEDLEIKNRLVLFIKNRIGVEVNDKTNLFSDLEMIGDDANFFMLDFEKEFEVKLDKFKFSEFFVEESSIPFYYWYLKTFKREKLKRKNFKLDHLVRVVKKGEWIEL